MSTRTEDIAYQRSRLAFAERALRAAKAQRKEIRRRIALLEALPDEPGADGTIITFQRYLGQRRQRYEYAALRTGGRWYTTGSTCPTSGFDWPGLHEFIANDGQAAVYHVVHRVADDLLL